MTSTNPTSTPRQRDWLSRVNWRPKLRWFVAEIVVVVMGVLIALTINAWWTERRDRAREQSYIREVIRNLRATDSSLLVATRGMTRTRRATSALLRAMYNPEAVALDSLARWLFEAQYVSLPTYSMGAVYALIETGDLHLIRDDSTRLTIMRTIDAVKEAEEREQLLVTALIIPILQRQRERTAKTNLYQDVSELDLPTDIAEYARLLALDIPYDESLSFESDYATLLRDEGAFTDWRVISDHFVVLQRQYELVHEVVRYARQHVEGELVE